MYCPPFSPPITLHRFKIIKIKAILKRKVLLFSLCLSACLANSYAEKAISIDKDNTEKTTEEEPKKNPG